MFVTDGDGDGDSGSQTGYTLEDAGLSKRRASFMQSDIERVEGVGDTTLIEGVVFAELPTARRYSDDDSPSPLQADSTAFDTDDVRMNLLLAGAGFLPARLNERPDGMMEYAIPLGADPFGKEPVPHIGVPSDRRTSVNGTVALGRRVVAKAVLTRHLRNSSPGNLPTGGDDVPALVEMLTTEVPYLSEQMAREVVCAEIQGVTPETAPYGDFRDASQEERRAMLRKMRKVEKLHSEVADLYEGYDSEAATRHRNEAIDIGAGHLQFGTEEDFEGWKDE